METLGFKKHDHSTCIADSIATIDAHCKERGLQFTPVRRRVLEILLERHQAMGAYEILDVLRSEGLGSQPPVAYRALDFLTQNGFVHKIERINAFVACAHPESDHAPAFLVCRDCNAVAESHATADKGELAKTAEDVGFIIERVVVEAEGLCPSCQ